MLGKLMMEGNGAEVQAFAENIMGEDPNPGKRKKKVFFREFSVAFVKI